MDLKERRIRPSEKYSPMLTAALCIAAALWTPGLVILAVSARRAPRGFEDERGFHEIAEPQEGSPVYGATAHSR